VSDAGPDSERIVGFSECHPVRDGGGLQQGDVLRSVAPRDDLFAAMGIVITADCDIEHEKHNGLLTFVPLLRLEDYLSRFYLPKRIEKLLSGVETELARRVHAFQRSHPENPPLPLTETRVVAWLREVGADEVLDALRVEEPKQRGEFTALAAVYGRLFAAADATLPAQFAAYGETMLALRRAKSVADAHRRLGSDVDSFLSKLPGDAMLINSLGPGFTDGYVAYLRLPREIREWQIARTAMRQSSNVTMERFARLSPPYLYHLTQQFAAVFSSIGLPSEYEEERALTAQLVRPPQPS
jgi:hypothetical protein